MEDRRALSPRWVGVTVAIVLATAAAGFAFYFSSSSGPSVSTVSSESTPLPTTTGQQGSVTTSLTPPQGIQLNLSMTGNSPTGGVTLKPGDLASITISEYNPATTIANVSRASHWSSDALALGPCGTSGFPVGIAVLQGHYTSSNLTSGTPLRIFKPTAPCPAAVAAPPWYAFQPQSDLAVTSIGAAPMAIRAMLGINGTWSGGDIVGKGAAFSKFAPGRYTVVGGDEWGQLALQYFSVLAA